MKLLELFWVPSVSACSTAYVLPISSSYIVVDPITVVAQGSYNTVTHMVNGATLSNGYVIAPQFVTDDGRLTLADDLTFRKIQWCFNQRHWCDWDD